MVLLVQTKLLRSIDQHLTSYVELWNQLSNQLSNGLSDSQQFFTTLAPILQQKGLQSQLLSTHLPYAELKTGAPRTLLFYHHQRSVVPGIQELTSIVALLSALDACKNVLGFVPVNIQWLAGGNAIEISQEELEVLQPDACICYYAAEAGLENNETPLLVPATKGHLHVELEVQTGSCAIDSMHGSVVPDALWRLLWALGTLKDAHEDILIEGFYDTLASVQDDVMAQLRILPDNADELAQYWGIQQLLMGLHGFQLHYAHLLLPTCTVNSISSEPTSIGDEQGGTQIPGWAKAQVDFYLVPDQDPQDIFNKLQHHLQMQDFSDVQAHILSATNPLSTPVSNSFIQLAISVTEKAYDQTPFVLPITVGSYTVPASWMKDGMPTVFMARNEHNGEDKRDFGRMIKQIALLIEGMAHGTGTTE